MRGEYLNDHIELMADLTVNVDATAINAAIAAEASTRAAADTTLSGLITTEASARATGDTNAIATAATDATTKANAAQAAAISSAATDATTKANAAQAAAISAAATDATTKANAAQAAAIAASQPLDSDLTSYANAADAAARRALIGAGTGSGNGDARTSNPLSQFAATTSAQLAGIVSDETGSGSLVFATSPTLVTPALGTPSALVGTNITGTASGLSIGGNAATVTTNANLTGPVTSVGNATAIADGALSIAKTSGLQTALDAKGSMVTMMFLNSAAVGTWTNLPASEDFFQGSAPRSVLPLDLTHYTQCRVFAYTSTTGSAGSKLIVRYKTTSWSGTIGDYSSIGTSEVSCTVDAGSTFTQSSWTNIAAGAKADIFMALTGSGGNGVADPSFNIVGVQFRS